MWRRVTSQSPLTVDGPNRAYIKALAAMGEMLRSGRSWSGHERHCCFLNTHDGRFATISAASGIDHAEDGRAIGLSDWDSDGDLDVWMSNRTGPRLRFLRNDSDGASFVTFRLTGTSSNRDAIGARLELYPRTGSSGQSVTSSTKLMRTIHAGHGFLSQASKRIHFGLGQCDEISKLIVRWPSGDVQEFTQLQPNRHYEIVQGQSKLVTWQRPPGKLAITPSDLHGDPIANQSRIVINGRLPMPPVQYRNIQSDSQAGKPAPLLINLWSTTCTFCLRELEEFTRQESRLRAAGLNIIALNVDELNSDPSSDLTASKELLTKLKFPFAAAALTPEFSGALDVFHRSFLNLRLPLPIPSSFIVTADGRLAVIYRGPVSVDQVLRDLPILKMTPSELRQASVPFAGRWLNEPFNGDPKSQALAFMRSGYVELGKKYLEKYLIAHRKGQAWGPREQWTSRPRLAELCETLADFYRLSREAKGVLDSYQLAVEFNPRSGPAQWMLGKGLIDLGRSEDGLRRIEAAHHLEPTNLDIATDLAIGYAIVGKLDAARDLFRQLLAGHPERTDLHRHLARVYQQQNEYSQAIAHLRAYLEVSRNSIEAIHALAWILATAPATGDRNLDEAASWAERLTQLNADQSFHFHDLVAAIHAADGEFEQAVKHAEQAVELARDRGDQSVAAVEGRLELYRKRRAYTESHE